MLPVSLSRSGAQWSIPRHRRKSDEEKQTSKRQRMFEHQRRQEWRKPECKWQVQRTPVAVKSCSVGGDRSYEVTCTGATSYMQLWTVWLQAPFDRDADSRAKLGRDQTKSGKINGNQGLISGFTTGIPAPEVNLPGYVTWWQRITDHGVNWGRISRSDDSARRTCVADECDDLWSVWENANAPHWSGPSKIYPSEHVWEYRWELEAIPPAKGNLRTFRVQQPTTERGRDVRVLSRIDQTADQIV